MPILSSILFGAISCSSSPIPVFSSHAQLKFSNGESDLRAAVIYKPEVSASISF